MNDEPFIITVVQDMSRVSQLVNSFFLDDKKTTLWLNTSNPLLGDVTPMSMIFDGRTDKLVKFIESSLEGNFP